MKKIISFSLWGNDHKYTVGAIKNAKLAPVVYGNDWICRFYIGQSTIDKSPRIIKELRSLSNVEIVEMNESGDWSGMFWRFIPAFEDDVDIMLSRDTDSRLSEREKIAVDQWLESDKDFHIMRDHPYHTAKIMGGMWGCRNGILKPHKHLFDEYSRGDFWQVDQNFLAEKIYPIVKNSSFVHDSFTRLEDNSIHFPSERLNSGEFVGEIFDGGGNPNVDHRMVCKSNHAKKLLNKKLSFGIAIPTYSQHLSKLERLLDSINNQTVLPDEVSISISSVNSSSVNIQKNKYKFNIITTTTDERKNASQNRNIAASKLSTDIISFIDGDDMSHPQRNEFLIQSFESDTSIEVICHNFKYSEYSIDYSFFKNIYEKFSLFKDHIYILDGTSIYPRSVNSDQFHNAHITFRRDIFEKFKYDENISCEDSVFTRNLVINGYKISYIDKELSYYIKFI